MFKKRSKKKRSRYENLTAPKPQTADSPATAPPTDLHGEIMMLQRTIGNQATQQLLTQMPAHYQQSRQLAQQFSHLMAHTQHAEATPRKITRRHDPEAVDATPIPPETIQRLPTRQMVIGEIGAPHKDKKTIFGKTNKQSTRYKAVLEALDDHNAFMNNTIASYDSLGEMLRQFDETQMAIEDYTGSKKKDKKTKYFQRVLLQLNAERAQAVIGLNTYLSGYGGEDLQLRFWGEFIDPNSRPAPVIEDEDVTGSDRGGSHEVEKTNIGGQQGFYKENVNEIPNAPGVNWFGEDVLQGTMFEHMDFNARNNAYNVPGDAGMYDNINHIPEFGTQEEVKQFTDQHGGSVDLNLRLANRDVAMARLSQLLGADVIANAELAFRKKGKKITEGSLMDKAKGKQASDLTFGEQAGGKDQVDINDPNLQRLLSRLQLVDALAGQVDRNLGNFFIETDDNGNVIDVTGIDNDMAFGEFKRDTDSSFNFPGLSAYVDAELARRIIELDPGLFELTLMDLLTPDEISALLERWEALKNYLIDLDSQGLLLEPDQWDQASALGMMGEKYAGRSKKSYYGKVRQNYYQEPE